MKNFTQRGIALAIAIMVTVLEMFFLVFLDHLEVTALSVTLWVFVTLFTFFAVYIVAFVVIEELIFSRLKGIHKTITTLEKKDRKSEPKNISDLIQSIEKQVVTLSLRQSEEIDELRKIEGYRREFLGNVSHELKTPIFNTQGYIETLLDGGLEDEKIRKDYIEKASKNLDRLAGIVENLLQISQYETGRLVLELELFDIHQLTNDVFDSLAYLAEERKIKLRFKENSDKPVFVYADKTRIAQVLNNLVSNAIKYGRENGNVLVGFFLNGDILTVKVVDDGIGISPEYLPRLFERFYRIDKARSREKGGTGLGLSIVKHIVEAHGQNISVESTIGIGTTFRFTLRTK